MAKWLRQSHKQQFNLHENVVEHQHTALPTISVFTFLFLWCTHYDNNVFIWFVYLGYELSPGMGSMVRLLLATQLFTFSANYKINKYKMFPSKDDRISCCQDQFNWWQGQVVTRSTLIKRSSGDKVNWWQGQVVTKSTLIKKSSGDKVNLVLSFCSLNQEILLIQHNIQENTSIN